MSAGAPEVAVRSRMPVGQRWRGGDVRRSIDQMGGRRTSPARQGRNVPCQCFCTTAPSASPPALSHSIRVHQLVRKSGIGPTWPSRARHDPGPALQTPNAYSTDATRLFSAKLDQTLVRAISHTHCPSPAAGSQGEMQYNVAAVRCAWSIHYYRHVRIPNTKCQSCAPYCTLARLGLTSLPRAFGLVWNVLVS